MQEHTVYAFDLAVTRTGAALLCHIVPLAAVEPLCLEFVWRTGFAKVCETHLSSEKLENPPKLLIFWFVITF